MNLRDLLVLYALVGLACAIAVLRRGQAEHRGVVWSAVATVPLWPLWAPFVLSTPRPGGREPCPTGPTTEGAPPTTEKERRGSLSRIDRALEESVKAVAGTPMSQVFSRQVAQRIGAEVLLVAKRIDELTRLASSDSVDRAASAARLQALEALGDAAPPRTLATARLQHESFSQLEALHRADAQALDELADLLEALRAQLLLARYAGSTADATGAIVSEVWARLEGLGAAAWPTAYP